MLHDHDAHDITLASPTLQHTNTKKHFEKDIDITQ